MVDPLVNGALNAGDLKRDIPDPVPGSEGGFLIQLVLKRTLSHNSDHTTLQGLPRRVSSIGNPRQPLTEFDISEIFYFHVYPLVVGLPCTIHGTTKYTPLRSGKPLNGMTNDKHIKPVFALHGPDMDFSEDVGVKTWRPTKYHIHLFILDRLNGIRPKSRHSWKEY